MPEVDISLSGNKSFYFPQKPVQYTVRINDKDDADASKNTAGLYVIADYIEDADHTAVPMGHLQPSVLTSGKNTMLSSDCKSCHQVTDKSIGPSFTQVADKYRKDPKAADYLLNKIKKGGGGVWGETVMSAHPSLPDNDIRQIVQWILSLSKQEETKKSLPASGSLQPTLGKPEKSKAALYLTASYTDKGGTGIKPLTGKQTVVLRSSTILFSSANRKKDFDVYDFNGSQYMIPPKGEGWFSIDSIDLSTVSDAELTVGSQKPVEYGYTLELHLDAPDGKLLGNTEINPPASAAKGTVVSLLKFHFERVTDGRFHNLYIVSKVKDAKEPNQVGLLSLKLIAK
jgi:cytochrome c551/c552